MVSKLAVAAGSILFSVFMLSAETARALTLDVNAFYFTDSLSTATTYTHNRLMWDFAATLNLTKKGDIVMGWSYGAVTSNDNSGTQIDYTATEMGPRLGYYIDRDFIWALFVTYNLTMTAKYTSGATNKEWRGTSLKGELAYMPHIGGVMQMGLKLNYYTVTIAEQITGSTTLAEVSYKRAIIYPSVAMIYRFD